LFKIYNIDYLFICTILAVILFLVNVVQIFMGVNFVFRKNEILKLIMNACSILLLIIFTFLDNGKYNFLHYICMLISAKLFSILILQIKYRKLK